MTTSVNEGKKSLQKDAMTTDASKCQLCNGMNVSLRLGIVVMCSEVVMRSCHWRQKCDETKLDNVRSWHTEIMYIMQLWSLDVTTLRKWRSVTTMNQVVVDRGYDIGCIVSISICVFWCNKTKVRMMWTRSNNKIWTSDCSFVGLCVICSRYCLESNESMCAKCIQDLASVNCEVFWMYDRDML